MIRGPAIAAVLAAVIAACGPSRQGGYPSYEEVVSRYVPPGGYVGEPLDDGLPRPAGSCRDCPRIWYDGHWVYYHHGRWIYRHHGYWYYYPYFYVHYWGGVPYVYHGPHYGIRKTGGAPSDPAAAVPAGRPAPRRVAPPPGRSAPPPKRSAPPPSRGRESGSERRH